MEDKECLMLEMFKINNNNNNKIKEYFKHSKVRVIVLIENLNS